MADREILEQQIAFYRARAPEYDQSIETRAQLEEVKRSLLARRLGAFGFEARARRLGESFFSILGQRRGQ